MDTPPNSPISPDEKTSASSNTEAPGLTPETTAALSETPSVVNAQASESKRENDAQAYPKSAPCALTSAGSKGCRTCSKKSTLITVGIILAGALAIVAGSNVWFKSRALPYDPVQGHTSTDPSVVGTLNEAANLSPSSFIVEVAPGDSGQKVLEKLEAAGLAVHPTLFRLLAKVYDTHQTLKSLHVGRYRIETPITPEGLLATFRNGALADDSVRIPDGATLWEVRALFKEAKEMRHETDAMSEAELASALGIAFPTPEGFFAPDTYQYAPGSTDLKVMKMAVQRQKALLQQLWNEPNRPQTLKTPYQLLILASIVERETGAKNERELVSSVFHNRLGTNMPLQSDPTVIYGLGPNFKGSLKKDDLRRPTPFNTYTLRGLPETPIGSPS